MENEAKGLKKAAEKINGFSGNNSQAQGLGETLTSITMDIILFGNFKNFQNFLILICEIFADIGKKILHHSMGERANTDLITPFFAFITINVYASLVELFNSNPFSKSFISTQYVLGFSKLYVLASLAHWLYVKYRMKYSDKVIFSNDGGIPFLYKPCIRISQTLKLKVLSQFDFVRYVESSLWFTIGLIVKSLFYLTSLGNLFMLIGFSLYVVYESQAKRFRDAIVNIRDSNIVQSELSRVMQASDETEAVTSSHLFNHASINNLIKAKQEKIKLDDDLEALIQNQKLD